MALLAGVNLDRRGPPPAGGFGYPVAAGERVFKGGVVAVNAAGSLQRVQTAGSLVIVGIAHRDLDNTAGAAVSDIKVEALKGIYSLTVPSATAANINAAVFATDDATLTLTQSGSLLAAGTLVGIESGQTYVKMIGG